MKNHRIIAPLALGLLAAASIANAQDQSTRMVDRYGNSVTINSGQPPADHYGPAPSFEQLDVNHDGKISREEAGAYIPLLNDFDFLAHHANTISRGQFERWNATQNRQ